MSHATQLQFINGVLHLDFERARGLTIKRLDSSLHFAMPHARAPHLSPAWQHAALTSATLRPFSRDIQGSPP